MNANTAGQGPWAKGQGFRSLVAWQRAHELALAVFKITRPLTGREAWLVRQITSSAVSVPANIAEGFSRSSTRDYLRYLNIARGSLAETEYYLLFLVDSGLVQPAQVKPLSDLRHETGNLLAGLIRALERKVTVGEERVEYLTEPNDSHGPWPLAPGLTAEES